ncbi:MAG: hypothetical protein ACO3CI_00745 [Schleiferiaceae bacterium]
MRQLIVLLSLLVWGSRTLDPLVHGLAHHHHDHCAESGQHLHDGDDSCSWSDPAVLWAFAPPQVAVQDELVPGSTAEPGGILRAAAHRSGAPARLRGPPQAG